MALENLLADEAPSLPARVVVVGTLFVLYGRARVGDLARSVSEPILDVNAFIDPPGPLDREAGLAPVASGCCPRRGRFKDFLGTLLSFPSARNRA